MRLDGTINEGLWKHAILETLPLPAPLKLPWGNNLSASNFTCHKKLSRELFTILHNIHAVKEAWNSIDDYGGCYMWRANRNNPKDRSRHCWAIAIDLDTRDNPLGGKLEMHPHIIKTFEGFGWIWGGRFPTPDGMHFEKGYVEG